MVNKLNFRIYSIITIIILFISIIYDIIWGIIKNAIMDIISYVLFAIVIIYLIYTITIAFAYRKSIIELMLSLMPLLIYLPLLFIVFVINYNNEIITTIYSYSISIITIIFYTIYLLKVKHAS